MVCGGGIVWLAVNVAAAQERTKVEPKDYKLDFENDRVIVIDIHYGPHEKSELHDHPGGVVVNLTAGHLRFTDQNGKVHEVFAKAGESRWFPPVRHRVENLGDETYNAVYIAIKGKVNTASTRPDQESPAIAGQMAKVVMENAHGPS